MTHSDEWTVVKLRYYETSHNTNSCAWFVDMYFMTQARACEAFFPPF